jgi:signal transduction histidine kinase/DNA-binding response OmpR family regulator
MEPLLNILMVEDNPGDVVIVKELLKSQGINFNFTHVTTLKETLLICVEREYDIILLDLGLPDSVGLETLKKIQVFNVKSPVVVMTGLDDEDIALASLREGAQDYLVKNRLTSDSILRTIKYSIERKKIQELQKRNTYRFSILSTASASLNECEDIPSIFRIICENLSMLLEKAGAIVFEFLDPVNLRVSGTEWLKPWSDQIKLLTGWDMNNSVIRISNLRKEKMNSFYDGKLHKIDSGIFEIFLGVADRKNCAKLKDILDINNVYAIGFSEHKILYGGFLIFSKKMIGDDDINIIETISNQTSLCIHRRSIEKDLRVSEYRYKKLNKELEQKVQERTCDLETLNGQLHQELTDRIMAEEALKKSEIQLKDLNTTKDKFFNIVAHDLKNPFTSLLGSSELLFQNIHQMDNVKIKKLALILNDSAKSGYAILQNLLDWSRSQTGLLKINPERINIKNLIDDNILNLELFSANKEIKIHSEVEEDIFLFADKNMVNTILRNLLSNALKFSYRCGKVIVRAGVDRNQVIISIKDCGVGIPKENIDKIFRIDTKYSMPGTENEQGTGLGLKLSKEFVEKQGGKIWVESTENKGSEFKFSFSVKEG